MALQCRSSPTMGAIGGLRARACTAVVFDRSAVDFRTALRSISPVFERSGQQTPHRGVPVPRDVEFPRTASPRSQAPPNCYCL